MSKFEKISVHVLRDWQWRYALARYVGRLDVRATPSLRNQRDPFSVYEMCDRPSYSYPDGKKIPGKRTKQVEPRPLKPEELRSWLDKYLIPFSEDDKGVNYIFTVEGFAPFVSTDLDEAKGRAIVAKVTRQKEVEILSI